MFSHESEILRNLRLTEWQKTEVLTSVSQLYQAIAKNSEEAICESLGKVVLSCYVLGRRLGVNFNSIDEAIVNQVNYYRKKEDELEKCFGDYSELERHIRTKR